MYSQSQGESINYSLIHTDSKNMSNLSINMDFDRKLSYSSINELKQMNEMFDFKGSSDKELSFQSYSVEQERTHKIQYSINYKMSENSIEDNQKMFEQVQKCQKNLNKKIQHQCSCDKQTCNKELCECILFMNEPCKINLCCSKCISYKDKKILLQSSEYKKFLKQQKMKIIAFNKNKKSGGNKLKNGNKSKIQRQKYDFLSCTCKKTHCMKKYCPCYAMNKQCNQFCLCQQCQNKSDDDDSSTEQLNKLLKDNNKLLKLIKSKQQYKQFQSDDDESNSNQKIIQKKNQQIDHYFEYYPEDYSGIELNLEMVFEPVNFQNFMNPQK